MSFSRHTSTVAPVLAVKVTVILRSSAVPLPLAAGRRASLSGGQTVRKRGRPPEQNSRRTRLHRKAVFRAIPNDSQGSSGMIANDLTRRDFTPVQGQLVGGSLLAGRVRGRPIGVGRRRGGSRRAGRRRLRLAGRE